MTRSRGHNITSSRKVVYTSFQELYHDYVILSRGLLLFTLSILQIGQPVVLCIRALDCRFYNSKSSISNVSASPFGKITIRAPLQWFQDLMLDGALATVLWPISLGNKISSELKIVKSFIICRIHWPMPA